jgi:hypothetical protein
MKGRNVTNSTLSVPINPTPAGGGDSKIKNAISGLIVLLLGVLVVSMVGFALHHFSADPQKTLRATVNGTINTPQGILPHAFIQEGVYPDSVISKSHGASGGSHPGWPSYGPATHLWLPAHSYVTMTLMVYDSGEELNHAYFAKVIGTVDGTMSVDGKSVTALAPTNVQHTFTLHGIPTSTQDPLFLNIPLPKMTEDQMKIYNDTGKLPIGHKVVFSFITGGKGEYVWNCEYPCGDGTYQKFGAVMGQIGYMSGKVSVG